MRVGTGTVKGRRLRQITGSIRPTSGRVRGALFDMQKTLDNHKKNRLLFEIKDKPTILT